MFLKIRPKCPLLFFLKNGMIVNGTFVLIESPAGVFSPVPLWRRSIMARHQQFGGFGGGANMQQLMRQAQKLQEQMTKAQEDIEAREFSAQAGGGMVSVTVNGKHEVTGIQIKPECVDPEDVEMLQDMVMAAVNEALHTAEETRQSELGKLAPGMGGMF